MPEKSSSCFHRSMICPKESVCIHTRKIYDSHREKECIKDIPVYLTRRSQEYLDSAVSVKAKNATLLYAFVDVAPILFQKGYYTVDVKYYYQITADACSALGRAREIYGVAIYNKRSVLFGSDGGARIFSSSMQHNTESVQNAEQSNLPIAVVETVDPVILAAQLRENDCCNCECSTNYQTEIPAQVCACFEEPLILNDTCKQLLITLGQFSILRLERDIQLTMPVYNICLPQKEHMHHTEDPCQLFQTFQFPVNEFYPPNAPSLSQSPLSDPELECFQCFGARRTTKLKR